MKIRTVILGATVALALPLVSPAQDATPASTPGATVRSASQDIDIGELVARYAKRTGRQFILDPRVRGPVQLAGLDVDRIGYEQLIAILAVNQLAAVAQGDWVVVVPDSNARQLATPVFTDRNFKTAAPDELVTLVVSVKNICAAPAVPVLRPFMPQSAHMAAYVETNTLLLSDHASNLHRLVTVIEALERTGEKDPVSVAQCAGRFGSKSVGGK